ncbi:tRNA (cytosine-5-)-methyltransferase NSUN2-like protein [Achlya hypogyna]|uniref:tRNA (Cytosine-5-)-methyltransferase NSUN2-like protein n=1 Tax=Achlya hypogyna TaxID=1202772 RepID=A0A1V9ZIW1_ACHHY|nr:tRNA (cytosine-5-)-methyltransferase NSUN2-like protein [Achlya hypogyna]
MAKGKKASAAKAAGGGVKRKAYYSDSEDDDAHVNFKQAVPLASLENAPVRDFTDEVVKAPKTKSKKAANKKTKSDKPVYLANEPTPSKKQAASDETIEQRKRKSQQQNAIRSEKLVWRKFGRENTGFEEYYGDLWRLPKDEWKELSAALESPPSVHFRINETFPSLSEIAKGSLDCDFDVTDAVLKLPTGGERTLSLGAVPYDPSIFKINVDSKLLRKTPRLQAINNFIRDQTLIGTVLRQEAMNMLLPRFLDVQAHHNVLDLHGSGASRAAPFVERMLDAESKEPTGALVINEPDAASATKAARVVAQTVANASNVVVTSHKTEEFPEVADTLVFDRVLCSVPCSGDGSIRKYPEKWRNWTPTAACGHHATQLELAQKALHSLKVGGLMVYCTRSFHPIENEAIVAQVLRAGAGAYELVNAASCVPELKTRPGVAAWKVCNDELSPFASYDAASEADRRAFKLRPSMFAPTKDEAAAFHLDRCLRVLPHDNDTHGFFIAVVKKSRELARITVGPAMPASATSGSSKKSKEVKRIGLYSPVEAKNYEQLQERFALDLSAEQLLEHVNFTKTRDIHYVTPAVAELLRVFAGKLNAHKAGTPAFQVQQSAYSLLDEGLHAILPHCHERIVTVDMAQFSSLVSTKQAWLQHLAPEVQAQVGDLPDGSIVLTLDESEPIQTADRDIALVAMKRHSSITVTAASHVLTRMKTLMLELNVEDEDYDSMDYDE